MPTIPVSITPPGTVQQGREPGPITVSLGPETHDVIDREGPEARTKAASAVARALLTVFPGRPIEVSFATTKEKSFIRCDDDEQDLAARAVPVIMSVLHDPWRYEWSKEPLATAYQAVTYLLNRIQADADLGHLISPLTESFRLLVAAEARESKRPLAEVYAERSRTCYRWPREYFKRSEIARAPEHTDEEEPEEVSTTAEG